MLDLDPINQVILGASLVVLFAIAVTLLNQWLDDKLKDRPDMTRMHYMPREDYIRHVDGVDAEAVRRAARRANPVVPPESPFDEPYHYRKN